MARAGFNASARTTPKNCDEGRHGRDWATVHFIGRLQTNKVPPRRYGRYAERRSSTVAVETQAGSWWRAARRGQREREAQKGGCDPTVATNRRRVSRLGLDFKVSWRSSVRRAEDVVRLPLLRVCRNLGLPWLDGCRDLEIVVEEGAPMCAYEARCSLTTATVGSQLACKVLRSSESGGEHVNSLGLGPTRPRLPMTPDGARRPRTSDAGAVFRDLEAIVRTSPLVRVPPRPPTVANEFVMVEDSPIVSVNQGVVLTVRTCRARDQRRRFGRVVSSSPDVADPSKRARVIVTSGHRAICRVDSRFAAGFATAWRRMERVRVVCTYCANHRRHLRRDRQAITEHGFG